ncbi:hypothetical protein QZH41_006273 [Actinostola sp. cb2023]|nr:hypothetical protein QZH41_006273 [Actinostola sp. cb2023]
MLRHRQQTRRDHVVSLLPPISIASTQPMSDEERIFSDAPPPIAYTGSFPSKVLRHLDKSTFYSTPTKGEAALANKIMYDAIEDKNNVEVHVDQSYSPGHYGNHHNNNKLKKITIRKTNEQMCVSVFKHMSSCRTLPIVERRCSSAPGSRDDDRSKDHETEVGNLTAPSTPRLDSISRQRMTRAIKETNTTLNSSPSINTSHTRVTCSDNHFGGLYTGNDIFLELRGDSIELHSLTYEIPHSPIARPNTRAETPPDDYPGLQESKAQPGGQVCTKIRSAVRNSLCGHAKQAKQQPKFEVRAVGYSLSRREKRETGIKISKPTENSLQPEVENENLKTSEQSDLTITIPVDGNLRRASLTDEPISEEHENNTKDPLQELPSNEQPEPTINSDKKKEKNETIEQTVDERTNTDVEEKNTRAKRRRNTKVHGRKK